MSVDEKKETQTDPRAWVGAHGEGIAAAFLEERGWEIVERNKKFKIGELDLVARRYEDVGSVRVPSYAFVEVKTRRSSTHMRAGSNITRQKRSKLVSLVKLYLAKNELKKVFARIDVIEVDLSEDEPTVEYFPRAIDADGRLR
ncbi:MAG: YraN family protein [Myxococcota bacterium]